MQIQTSIFENTLHKYVCGCACVCLKVIDSHQHNPLAYLDVFFAAGELEQSSDEETSEERAARAKIRAGHAKLLSENSHPIEANHSVAMEMVIVNLVSSPRCQSWFWFIAHVFCLGGGNEWETLHKCSI